MALDVEPEVMINDPAKRREIATEEKSGCHADNREADYPALLKRSHSSRGIIGLSLNRGLGAW
jgi:hypothetical protein